MKGRRLATGYYFITGGAGTPAHAELSHELDELGLEFRQAQLGGAGEVVDVVVAWFSLHDFWVGVASGLVTTQIEKISSVVHKWVRRNKTPEPGHRNVIKLAVYEKKRPLYTLTIDVDREMSAEDVGKIIESANAAVTKVTD